MDADILEALRGVLPSAVRIFKIGLIGPIGLIKTAAPLLLNRADSDVTKDALAIVGTIGDRDEGESRVSARG